MFNNQYKLFEIFSISQKDECVFLPHVKLNKQSINISFSLQDCFFELYTSASRHSYKVIHTGGSEIGPNVVPNLKNKN